MFYVHLYIYDFVYVCVCGFVYLCVSCVCIRCVCVVCVVSLIVCVCLYLCFLILSNFITACSISLPITTCEVCFVHFYMVRFLCPFLV